MNTPTNQGAAVPAQPDALTVDRLKEMLDYDPSNGVFTWIKAARGLVRRGDCAGSLGENGYVRITLDNKRYRAHRLAWFYVHGMWPSQEIDHINRIKHDNRIANLREATRAENNQNRPIPRSNKSGYRGVSKRKGSELWVAMIDANKRRFFLGEFKSPELAHAAYQAASLAMHTHRSEGMI